MLDASIRLSESQLKRFIIEGLAAAGVTTESAGPVYLSYDRGGGHCLDSGNGFTASVTVVLAGQKATLEKTEAELEKLVQAAAKARGYTVRSPYVGFDYDGGDGPRGGAAITATVFIKLPEKFGA